MKELLKDSYTFVREENDALLLKIQKKNKKIDELKQAITYYEEKLYQYEK
jgi:hypothetical protein